MYAFATAIWLEETGLTLKAQLTDVSGVAQGQPITTGFHEAGGGWYGWHYAGFAADFRGFVRFINNADNEVLALLAVNPEELEYVGDIRDLVGNAAGSGAWTVSVTVVDGDGDPVQNARVRMSSGVESYTVVSDSAGECTLNLNDAAWDVACTRPGYQFEEAGTPDAVCEVDGDDRTFTIVLAAVAVPPPSDPDLVVCQGVTRTEAGLREAYVAVTIELLTPAGPGGQHRRRPIELTSDAAGNWRIELAPGLYRIQRAEGPTSWKQATVPETGPYEFPTI